MRRGLTWASVFSGTQKIAHFFNDGDGERHRLWGQTDLDSTSTTIYKLWGLRKAT